MSEIQEGGVETPQRHPKHIIHNGMRYYSEEEIIEAMKIIVRKLDDVEQKRYFCSQHNFNHEVNALDCIRATIREIQFPMEQKLDLLGRINR